MSKAFKSQQSRQFKFWFAQTLNDGMQYESALFQRICTLSYEQRQQLYQQATELAQQGADTMITYKDENCHLWLNLKSKALYGPIPYQALVNNSPELSSPDVATPSPESMSKQKQSL